MVIFRYSLAASLIAVAAATPTFAQTDEPVIIVTGTGLEATPAAPAYDTQEIDRDQLISVPSGRIEDALFLQSLRMNSVSVGKRRVLLGAGIEERAADGPNRCKTGRQDRPP